MADSRDDFKYEIIKELGVIGEGSRGWRKEVNVVSWNGRPPKLDIRDWSETREKMGKGVSLSCAETQLLLELLEAADLEKLID
jgi:hypothetical protein